MTRSVPARLARWALAMMSAITCYAVPEARGVSFAGAPA